MKTPPREFSFTAETFNLFAEMTQDGARVAREQAEEARREEDRRAGIRSHPQLALREEPASLTDIFGPVIYSYTRAQAIADGTLVDVGQILTPCPFKFPVAMTRAAWALTIEAGRELYTNDGKMILPGGQSIEGRLHDVFMMLLFAIRASQSTDRVKFSVLVDRNGRGFKTRVDLYSVCGPGDAGEPVITILQEGED